MTEVTLQNVRKEFDDVVAVDGIDLSIPDGEFVVVVGPSGCGKSTTLRLIAGLESVSAGDINMGEESVVDVPPDERNVAMVFQNYALYPHMSARRNITFGLRSTGSFSEAEVDDRVETAAETLGIADLLDRKPAALSGGERQRVALGRAIVRDPDVFLMDEPLSNLDAKLRIRMRSELAKLHEEFRTTTVYVTHDQTEAMTLGDRVAVMNDGKVEQVDPPQRLYDYPKTRFVAEFIGDPAMNAFPVELRRRDRGVVATHEGFTVPLPNSEDLAVTDGAAATLGIRPEDLSLAADAPPGRPDPFTATVEITEPLGDSLLLECRVGETVCRAQAAPRRAVEPGETVELTYTPERLHLFDETTGDAVYHAAEPDAPSRRAKSAETRP